VNNARKSYKLVICIAAVLICVAVSVPGCIFEKLTSGTGVISDVVMSTSVDSNGRPVNPTNVFSTDGLGFYCSFKVSGFPVGAKVNVQWIYLGGDPNTENITGKNYVAATRTAEITQKGSGYTYTEFTQPGIPGYKWPEGDYKVVISVDDVEKASTTFKVQE
jgi:hypothetical protein